MSERQFHQPPRRFLRPPSHEATRLCKRLRDRSTSMTMDDARRYLNVTMDELREIIIQDSRIGLHVVPDDQPGAGRYLYLHEDDAGLLAELGMMTRER